MDNIGTSNAILEKALELHRLFGFHMIPLSRDDKVPFRKWKRFQAHRPTPIQLETWLADQWPGCNYAILTGKGSGVVAVEADDSKAVEVLMAKLAWTPFRQRSRRGEHWLFRWPGFKVGNRIGVSIGGTQYKIDVKGDGGYIVGPGSVHPSGHVYAECSPWTREALQWLPPFDPAWIDPPHPACRSRPADDEPADLPPLDNRQRAALRYLSAVPGTRQGQQASNACFRLACKLVHGFALTPEEALPVMAEWGRREDQLDDGGGWWPWTEDELWHKLADADCTEDWQDRPRGYALSRLSPTTEQVRRLEKLYRIHQGGRK